ncbi:high frequency lysogenization protein HflD [Gammaproteobacteria bacterium]|nr:high frequency lysogenization protein HflD [Gammaproteobacteria bacterium]
MMTNDNTVVRNRCIALAGIFQAARLVQQTGHAEKRDPVATTACIHSLFVTDPQAVSDVYGSTADLQVGLQTLQQQLSSSPAGRDLELAGYVITMMHLQRKLRRRDDLMKTIRAGLDGLTPGAVITISDDVELIAGLADVYKETISTLSPRIMVKGDENVLGNSSSQNMIRALLLAGIRATVLWSQYGGSRIKLIFQRKVMIEQCSRMLRAGVQSV